MSNEFAFVANAQNTTNFEQVRKQLEKCNVRILIGFPSGRPHIEARHEQEESGKVRNSAGISYNDSGEVIDTAELAEKLHYGSGNIPARPFLDDGIESKKEQILLAMKAEVEKVNTGNTPNWHKLGTMAVGAVQEFVRGPYYKSNVPNAPKTVEKKDGDTPLIDGGDMINSLTYLVEG